MDDQDLKVAQGIFSNAQVSTGILKVYRHDAQYVTTYISIGGIQAVELASVPSQEPISSNLRIVHKGVPYNLMPAEQVVPFGILQALCSLIVSEWSAVTRQRVP